MAPTDAKRALALKTIDRVSAELRELSLSIHETPELNFEEHHAHSRLTDFLESKGFRVERGAYEMSTAFEAVTGSGGPTLAVLSEYDALPGIGHACGHNLIAISGVAVGLALKEALGDSAGTVVILGSPAEEGGGGKICMIDRGAFESVDAAMMLHPAPHDSVWFQANAIQTIEVEYHGQNAHAGSAPWEGINALDAMISAFNNVSMMRQQLRPTDRVHGVITDGGLKPNIIPHHTAAEFYIRSVNVKQLEELQEKVRACFTGAAEGTRCRLDFRLTGTPYSDVVVNDVMGKRYALHFRELGGTVPSKSSAGPSGFSTDMGNVSYTVPSIHPMFAIPVSDGVGNHTPGFTACAATEKAHEASLRASKSLALTALDLFDDPALLAAAKDEFEATTVAG
ncbi:MAG TPA: M20 family metallopeptidase [Dehalococcoidia bacterium]|nr:M20 family metallopeptidase [Dehalococcoidia bacterium]